jgi:hypothetical protein
MCSVALRMTPDGRPYARFKRALEVRSVSQAELAARERTSSFQPGWQCLRGGGGAVLGC